MRSDAKKKCTSSTAYACGDTCINNEKRCRVKGGSVASPEELKSLVAAGKSIKSGGTSQVEKSPADNTPKIPPMAGALGKAGAIAAGAALLGLPVAAYSAFRTNYRNGFKESARQATEMAKGIEVTDLGKDKSHVTFTIGGFSGDASGGDRLKNSLGELGIDNHHLVPISNEEFDIRTPEEVAAGVNLSGQGDAGGKSIGVTDVAVRGLAAFTRNTLQSGRNPVSVKIAAQAYAYSRRYPDKPITLVGHSAGGISSREAAEILNELGVKTKVIAFASPHFGLTEPTDDTITIGSRNDAVLKQTGYSVMNGTWINSVQGHQMKEYFSDDSFREFMKMQLNGARQDAIAGTKKRCLTGKPCGDACIAKGLKCQIQLSPEITAKMPSAIAALKQNGAAIGRKKTEIPQPVSGGSPAKVVAAGVAAGVALLGISAAAYTAQKNRYERNFDESADMAKQQAKSYTVPDKLQAGLRSLGDQNPDLQTVVKSRFSKEEPEQITFTAGGFDGSGGKEADGVGDELSTMFPKHLVVAVETPEFDVKPEEGDRVYKPSYLKKAIGTLLGSNLKEGRNTPAVRMAARAYAYNQKFPGKPINLVGQSGGTMVVREAAELLERMGVKDVKVVSAAGPYFGLTKPRGITLASPNDPLVNVVGGLMPNQVTVPSVQGHSSYFSEGSMGIAKRAEARANGEEFTPNKEVLGVLSDYFNRSNTKTDAADPLPAFIKMAIEQGYQSGISRILSATVKGSKIQGQFADRNQVYNFDLTQEGKLSYVEADARQDAAPPTKEQQQFIMALRTILERSYTDGIDRFVKLDITPTGDISGIFRDGNRYIQFSLNGNSITTSIAKPSRQDSLEEDRFARWDAPIKARKRQCQIGLSCGGTCIAGGKTCRIGTGKVAQPGELRQLRQLAIAVRQPDGAASARDPLDDLDIRSLKKEAQKAGINRYSYMTKEELKGAIRTVGQSAPQEERIRKTLERRKAEKEAIENTKPGAYAKTWGQLQKILKVAGVRPDLAVGAIGALIIGTSYKVYSDLRQHYRDGLRESSETATARAEKIDVPRVANGNITFAVGGFRGDGSTGGEIKQRLEEADPWFKRSHKIIPFDSDDYDFPPTDIPKKNSDGSYNPAYLGYVATQGFGASLRNFYKQRNEGSVELAAQLYAYANATRRQGDKLVPIHEDKPIHVVAHGAGGLTAREAMDILAGMPEGKKVLQRINLISMGTPDFGFTEPTVSREMTLSGTGDPWSILPTRKEKRVPSVKGHEIEDYLGNEDAIAQVARFLGKGRTSTYYEQERLRKEKAQAKNEKAKEKRRSAKENPPDETKKDSAYRQGLMWVLGGRS
ncbi:MAG TPA: hypothetical protein V6C57_10480 [Coleofasciculaceae cyanobacterium]